VSASLRSSVHLTRAGLASEARCVKELNQEYGTRKGRSVPMAIRDLIPWSRGRDVSVRRGDELNPFLTLHREMNRLFDNVFRGFDVAPFGGTERLFQRAMDGGWPNIEVSETGKEVKICAELPSLDEKDVQVELANGVLSISGEKKTRARTRTGYSASAITVVSSGGSPLTTWTKARSPLRSRTGS